MSALRLIDHNLVPPDGFRYTFIETGHRVHSNEYESWLAAIKRHYIENGLPVPVDYVAQSEHQLCQLLPAGFCQYEDGTAPATFINRRFSLGDAINGTQVLVEFVKQGCPIVAQEVAEERAKICSACYALVGIPGCAPCVGFSNLVAEACGAKTTTADHLLEGKVCGACLCSARANCWIPVEVSKVGVTLEALSLMPEAWCWKKREIIAGNFTENGS